jgi:hypothetical protein
VDVNIEPSSCQIVLDFITSITAFLDPLQIAVDHLHPHRIPLG